MSPEKLPHPITGELFSSPVPPGRGWPGDPAGRRTPVAHDASQVAALAGTANLARLDARVSVCRACPRLVTWREDVAETKRASFAHEPYWGRPIAGWGAARPTLVIMGLAPAANGGNRTGRVFTGDQSGDWLFASMHRTGWARLPTSTHAGDGQELIDARVVAAVRCAPPENKPTVEERDTCAPWVDRELVLVSASMQVLLCLGGFGWDAALRALRGAGYEVPRPKPRFGHAAEVFVPGPHGGVTLLGCYHPSQHNTFTGRLTREMTDVVFARARRLVQPDEQAAPPAVVPSVRVSRAGPPDGTIAGMTSLAITVLGHDRPGIIAETTEALQGLGLNIEDSTMTLLRGHFAMMLICQGAATAPEVEQRLAALTADGSLSVAVREVPAETTGTATASYLLSVHGGDRPGIVSRLVGEVAAVGGNITDLSTRLAGELYVLSAEVDLPAGVDVAALETALRAAATELGVGASLHPLEADEL